MATANLTAQRLRELLRYEPETGAFFRLVAVGGEAVGKIAGCKAVRGEWSISIDYKRYKAHRLAWLYMTGEWPTQQIDHRDVNPLNNRFDNLREATDGQNKQNKRQPRRDNTSGYYGVYLHGKSASGALQWRSRIQVGGKVIHLGLFSDPALASQAYLEAKRKLHPFGTL